MKKHLLLAVILVLPFIMQAQEEEAPKFGIQFSGFVKSDFFVDSRQTVSAREGHFMLFPATELLDADKEDINAKANFNFLSVQSRLSGKITGPDAFGAKTSGLIEGDFFAQANDNINLLRLRHAFVKFDWENTQMIFGQYWNPMFVTGCFPGTVSFNSGSPFQPFARNPQIRVTHKIGGLKLIAAAQGQRDYTSRGPAGTNSEYLRNSAIPEMHAQIHYGGENYLVGAGAEFKTIVPRIEDTAKDPNGNITARYKVDEKLSTMGFIAFASIKLPILTAKFEAIYGDNMCDVLLPGGFAVSEIPELYGSREYTALKTMTFWTDIHTNGKKFQAGLFVGFGKNLGTNDEIKSGSEKYPSPILYGLMTNFEDQLRVSPRLIFNSGKARFALELEYTELTYGTEFDNMHIATKTNTVSNVRGLLAVYYFF